MILDLGELRHICSPTLSVILRIHRRLQESGSRLQLRNVSAGIEDVFHVTRLHDILNVESRPSDDVDASNDIDSNQLRFLFEQHGVIGQSDVMLDVYRQAHRASQFNDVPILITGETGTGKEVLARAIHAMDPLRNEHKFVAIN